MNFEVVPETRFSILPLNIQEDLRGRRVVPVNDKFVDLYKLPAGTNFIILIGGRGGVKTTEASRFIALKSSAEKKRCVILRDEKELIRESILNEVRLRFEEYDPYFNFSQELKPLETGIKLRDRDEMLVFTKGFRASASHKRANLKSISNVDIALGEEFEDVRSEEQFNTFADSIRKAGALIIIVLNTPDINHFLIKRYFNLEQVEDGYFRIIPKKIPGFFCIQTSFTDNPHLPPHIVKRYQDYGNPDSPLYDRHYYLTAIMGYASTGRKGQVFKKVKPISLREYMALPYKEHYGQDFGTASPAGMVGVKIHRNTVWARQLNYQPKDTLEIGKHYCTLGLNKTDKIVCDSAEPKTIAKLRSGWRGDELSEEEFRKYPSLAAGFNVVGAKKGPDSVVYGIGLLNSMNLFVVEEHQEFWTEMLSYVYDQDKNGNYTDEPIDDFNHLIDPLRYVVMDQATGTRRGSISA